MPHDPLAASGIDRQIGFALRGASIAVWKHLRRTLEPFGLRPQTYAILRIVATSPGCRQQEVADALGIQRPNLVAMIDELCARALLIRRVNAQDRRSYTLKLAKAGRALLERAQKAHAIHERDVASALGDCDPAAVHALLARLAGV